MNSEKRFQFVSDIRRITGGIGGESLLIIGSEKTAAIDCGMAYCGDLLVENCKEELNGRTLDYVFLSHTHYDHIGGLPYLRREWPHLIALGARHGKQVLEKPTALNRIKGLSQVAWCEYRKEIEDPPVLMEGMKIDKVVEEDDLISLGDKSIRVYETPGHTSCSLTFVLEPDAVIFPSETVGVLSTWGTMSSPMLKSYRDTIDSIEKCKRIETKHIICPHYGQVPEEIREGYWDLARRSADHIKEFILQRKETGLSFDDLLVEYTREFWIGFTAKNQPKEAFVINAKEIIRTILRECD